MPSLGVRSPWSFQIVQIIGVFLEVVLWCEKSEKMSYNNGHFCLFLSYFFLRSILFRAQLFFFFQFCANFEEDWKNLILTFSKVLTRLKILMIIIP